MRSPCLPCELRDKDKNNDTCLNCKARIAYDKYTGQPEPTPTARTITKKEDKPMPAIKINVPTSCPFGHNFGIDHDTRPECDGCNEFAWGECRKWHENMPKPMTSTNHEPSCAPTKRRGRPPKNPAVIPAKQTVKIPRLVAPKPEAVPKVTLDLSKFKKIEFDQRYFSTPTMGVRDESISFNTSAVKEFWLKDFSCLDIRHDKNRLALIPTDTETQFRMKFHKSYCVVTSRRLIRHLKVKPGKYQIRNCNGVMLVEVAEK